MATDVSTAVTGMQSQITTQACSGLNWPILQTRPNSHSTFNHENNAITLNSSTHVNLNAITAGSLETNHPSQLGQSQRKVLVSSDLKPSKVKIVQDILSSWHKGNANMGLLVPLHTLTSAEKKSIDGTDQRCSQFKCIAMEYEKLGGNGDGDANVGTFKEV